ncbi:MAG TPA: DUF3631 domain-containing protein, partial [Plantibacter sp.]|uniref:DUF3631 domain-containing protein n=1 Tax=Plantibacter sp. TaxID=1871045 RepID=UPI002B721EF3|nr:DUF3631 domain-containing protein [Plantibacter sp.]
RGGADQELHDDDAGVRLVADIQRALGDEDRISTEDLISALSVDKEAPWATWHRGENPISARALAGLLRGFGVRSRTIRLEDGTTPKGYLAEQFRDLFGRYLPENASLSATTPQLAWLSQKEPDSIRHTESVVADEKPLFPAWIDGCGVMADREGKTGDGGDSAASIPLPGDPGYAMWVDRKYTEGHLHDDELRSLQRVSTLIARRRAEMEPAA